MFAASRKAGSAVAGAGINAVELVVRGERFAFGGGRRRIGLGRFGVLSALAGLGCLLCQDFAGFRARVPD